MTTEQEYLSVACDQANQYIHHIDEALASVDADVMKTHVQEAMNFGRNMLVNLEEALDEGVEQDMARRIEVSMQYLGSSLDLGHQALSASKDDMVDLIAAMGSQANLSVSQLTDVLQRAS